MRRQRVRRIAPGMVIALLLAAALVAATASAEAGVLLAKPVFRSVSRHPPGETAMKRDHRRDSRAKGRRRHRSAPTAGPSAGSQPAAPGVESTSSPTAATAPIVAPEPPPGPTPGPEPGPVPKPDPAPEILPGAGGTTLFDSGFSSFAHFYVQAIETPEPRATILAGAGRFEVRPGDVEPDTGSQRAEVSLAEPKFYEGAEIWVYDKVRWSTEDTADPAWEVVDQFHDGSAVSGDPQANGSPAIALMRYGRQIRIANGKGTPIYWTGPEVELGRWYELVYHIRFSKTEGELEAFWDGVPVAHFLGPTMNSEYTYLKAGVYRAKETSAGISVVEHDEIGAATSLAALDAATQMQPLQ